MNLVQINERLKDMPPTALKQYANGSNPSIPPYLALAELQRRERVEEQMKNEMGAANAQQPSVKEQIEQKAGLLGLQQAQMQQQQQQMAQPRPGPVPAGTPEPEAQPEAEEMAMAGGGLAQIPVRRDMYQFAGGGIIAFTPGGDVPKVITIPAGTSDEEIDRIRQENPDAILRMQPKLPMDGESEPGARMAMPEKSAPVESPSQRMMAGAPNRSPLFGKAVAAAEQMPEKPTAEGINAGISALLPAELQDAARQKRAEEAKQRMADAAKAYEASKPDALDNLIRVFGQSGQYKGLSGLAPAYTRNREQQAARDAAFRREQEDMRAKAEGQQLKEAGELFGARSKDYTTQMEGYRKQLASRTEALASLAGVDQRAIDGALDRMNNMEIQKLRMAEQTGGERITAKILKLRAEGKVKEADEMLETYSTVIGSGAAGVGGERNRINAIKQAIASYKDIRENSADEAERNDASQQIVRLTKELVAMEAPGGGSAAKKPTTQEEYAKLPKGATYTAPDGTTRIKG